MWLTRPEEIPEAQISNLGIQDTIYFRQEDNLKYSTFAHRNNFRFYGFLSIPRVYLCILLPISFHIFYSL